MNTHKNSLMNIKILNEDRLRLFYDPVLLCNGEICSISPHSQAPCGPYQVG